MDILESVKTSGVIEPIVVTTDMVIVSGHQRVRACKELGIKTVLCEIKNYKDEDSVIKDLLETNIRQRGDIGGSAKKVGLRIKELERLYGIEHGGDRGNQYKVANKNNLCLPKFTQTDLAEKMGITDVTLRNYKLLSEMIPELEDLLDTGIVTKTTALAIMRNLSVDEQVCCSCQIKIFTSAADLFHFKIIIFLILLYFNSSTVIHRNSSNCRNCLSFVKNKSQPVVQAVAN